MKLPTRVASFVALIAASSLVFAQQRATAVADTFLPVLDSLAERVDSGTYFGVVAVVEVGGERVVEEAFGVRRRDPEEPMQVDTIFRIYSMTKPVTAVGAMILYEEGRFELDDPAAKYLPEFADVKVGIERAPPKQPMTVRDLLRHTSGLTYGMFATSEVDTLVRQADVLDLSSTLEDMVFKLGELPLKHHPGTQYEYSVSSDVLGRLIEVLAEMPLDRFFEERIFAPLGMVDTGFTVDPEETDRLAEIYARGGQGLQPADGFDEVDPTERPTFLSGGGGLFSTANDYMRFSRMLLNGGRLGDVRILKPETVTLMTRDHLGEIPPSGLVGTGGFGLGVAVYTEESDEGPDRGSYWWGGLAGTGFWIDPEQDVIGVFMIQNMMEITHTFAFQADVYRALGR